MLIYLNTPWVKITDDIIKMMPEKFYEKIHKLTKHNQKQVQTQTFVKTSKE